MKELFNELDISRSLKRISHEIIEKNKGIKDVVIVGIKTRGEILAKRIANIIKQIENVNVDCCSIDISYWRDDKKENSIEKFILEKDVTNKIVVLIDDVLFSGRTVRAAIDGIFSNSRAKEIQLAILVDRGHRQLPIKADYVGKNVPTSMNEKILVCLNEIDKKEGVFIK